MEEVLNNPPEKKRTGLVVGLIVLLVVMAVGGWFLYKQLNKVGGDLSLGGGQENQTAMVYLETSIKDRPAVDGLLAQWGMQDQETWQLPGGPVLNGQVKTIKVVTTTEPQPYNREDTADGPVGSSLD